MTVSLVTFTPREPDDAANRLRDADPNVRRVAILDLADLGDAAHVPSFVAALRSDISPEVREQAARVLAEWEQDDVAEALCAALTDADETVRQAASQSLSELKHARSAPVLLPWAEHPDPFVRESVLRGLRALRCPDAFAVANRALSDDAPAVRLEAIAVLGWLKDARALPSLAALCASDPDAHVRRASSSALGFACATDDTVVAALLTALTDDTWQVREQAAATLGKLRASTAGEPLVAALDDPYWQVRLRAVRALGQLRCTQAAPPIAALLRHPISNLRKEAALALGELGVRAVLSALQGASEDSDPDVRKAARIAIAQIEDFTSAPSSPIGSATR